MKGGIVQTHQDRVYQQGYDAGRKMGVFETRSDLSYRLPMGMGLGLLIGAVIQPIVFWVKGVCW